MSARVRLRRAGVFTLLAAGIQALAANATLGLPPLPAPPTALVELGRALFFERRLSVNGTLSCAMCHLPEQGYTSNELRTSVGMEGVSLRRNAPTLLNVAFVSPLFHDGRAASLEAQALMPLLHPDEMANPNLHAVVVRVAGWSEYRPWFQRAYGRAAPTAQGIAKALAAYERTLIAGESRFDRWHYGGEANALNAQEQRGYALFQSQGCIACHPVGERHALFSDQGFHNIGVQARSDALRLRDVQVQLMPGTLATLTPSEMARIGVSQPTDLGRREHTRDPADTRAFRTPGLRNVALTAPYMHDGSMGTLEEVVGHYARGGWPDDPAQDGRLRHMSLDAEAQAALVAFLKTLSSAHRPH